MRGEDLRTTSWALVFIFPFLVLDPHRAGASSSTIKARTKARLNLWHREDLPELARRDVAPKVAHPLALRSKEARTARRAVALLIHNQFVRAAGLSDSKGVANATYDTLDALPDLFKDPSAVEDATLRRVYGPKVTPTRATTTLVITPKLVRKCMESVAPLTTPHRDEWRADHLLRLGADQDCMAALTDMVAALVAGDATDATCDLLSSATLVILLKKTKAEMEALRAKQGAAYMQPQRPLGMGSTIPKLVASCVLDIAPPAIGWPRVRTNLH